MQQSFNKPQRRALAISEFCDLYGVGRTTAYREMAEGRLAFALVGRRRLIPADGAERWLQALSDQAGEA